MLHDSNSCDRWLAQANGAGVFCAEIANRLVSEGFDSVFVAVKNVQEPNRCALNPKIQLLSIRDLLHKRCEDLTTENQSSVLVHMHGVWDPILHRALRWAMRDHFRIVWSPHGMLLPWSMHYKWVKKIFAWYVYQKWDLLKAHAFHVTSEMEGKELRSLGFSAPLITVPLGTHLEELVVPGEKENILLFVSRVHPKKGLPQLIRAWTNLGAFTHAWRLRIVGPDELNHMSELRKLIKKLHTPHIEIVGPRYGEALKQEYAHARCFILPTFSENFGAVVLDALGAGLPVITTTGTPWNSLPEKGCGWWIENNVSSLEETLKEMLSMSPVELEVMGRKGRSFVEQNYTWDQVGKRMQEGYLHLLEQT